MKLCNTIVAASSGLILAVSAAGQSFNIDLNVTSGSGAGVPASTYAGCAGQPGVWNNITAATPAVTALVGLDGVATGVTLTRTTSGTSFVSYNNADTTGSFDLLMDDVHRIPSGGTLTYTFSNLSAGTYALYSYAQMGDGEFATVNVPGSTSATDQGHSGSIALTGNVYSFQFTHTIHVKDVPQGGSLTVTITGSTHDGLDPAHVAGLQLKKCLGNRLRFHVKNGASGLATGGSWTDAMTNLRDMFNWAWYTGPQTEIWVASGTYTPITTPNSTIIALPFNGFHLYGGFLGGETSLNQRLAPGTVVTTISGEVGTSAASDNVPVLLHMGVFGDGSVVDNITITRGYADQAVNDLTYGAAARLFGAAGVTFRNCTFLDNTSVNGGSIHLTNSSSADFIHCTFIDHTTTNAPGGAVQVMEGSTANFINCRFLGNSTIADGGAASIEGSTAYFTNCLFSGNSATSGGSRGGAVLASGAGTTVTFRNCTVGYNTCGGDCGGLYAVNGASISAGNLIAWGNSDATGSSSSADHFLATGTGSSASAEYVIVQGGINGVGNTNPQFVDANGADNMVGTIDDNYRLQLGSPAIDAGRNLLVPLDLLDLDGDGITFEFTPYDLAGGARIRDIVSVPDTGSGVGAIVDLGAYETVPPPCVGDFNGDGQRNTADLTIFLGQFGQSGPNLSADLNNDGTVNTADLTMFLSVFGVPCP